jgi:Cu-Zn family superoxide dismutase
MGSIQSLQSLQSFRSTIKNNEGVAVINLDKIKGVVIFTQKEDYVRIHIDVKGLSKNHKHGFHIHETGDLREGCKSCCAHYNPNNTEHGGLSNGHAGDLGNIITDDKGVCNMSIKTNKFSVNDILGRSIIIHEDEDDLGKGTYEDSKTTGHSGSRIACSVIGISKDNICK